MDLFMTIKNRRSVRAFTGEDVSEREVEKIIDAARFAPSAGNIQPWEFVIVRDTEIKQKLAEASLNQTFIEEAPVVVVVCADETQSKRGYGSRGTTLYCIQDTAAATQNILLSACALGLGTCWIGAFQEELVKKTLNMPSNVRPVAIIPIGRAAKRPRTPTKRAFKEIVHYETF